MNKSIKSFQLFDDDKSARYLADHWPKGRLTAKRHVKDSNIYNFILSLSVWIKIFIGDLFILAKNRDIQQADELLSEWEKSVKIPEEIPSRETIEDRRNAVECLFRKIPVYNVDNGIVSKKTTFENYVYCLTGIKIEIRSARLNNGGSQFPLVFPFKFGISSPVGDFVFIIRVEVSGAPVNNFFPLPFPVQFFTPKVPDATIELLDKVLDRVVPSFCRWEYEAVII